MVVCRYRIKKSIKQNKIVLPKLVLSLIYLNLNFNGFKLVIRLDGWFVDKKKIRWTARIYIYISADINVIYVCMFI